ncbi:MAG: hypothetical protein LBT15_00505 [Synergistaceae bacterium]|jgi:hypothetical protein|nr:hypothetical protein [Synergistaceae bacterium]
MKLSASDRGPRGRKYAPLIVIWWYVHEDDRFDFSDLLWEYGGRKKPKWDM